MLLSLSYDVIAEGYDELYGAEQWVKYKLILALVEPLEPVLDAGCGTGMLLKLLQCYSVGLDLSLSMLKVAKKKGRGERGDLVCGDAERMPFRNCCFHSAYSVTVAHEAPGLIGELQRVLAPNSRAAVTLLKKRSEMLNALTAKVPIVQVIEDETLKDVILVLEAARPIEHQARDSAKAPCQTLG